MSKFFDNMAAQQVFRSLMQSVSFPTRLEKLSKDALSFTTPMDRAISAILLTLLDNDTKLWLSPHYMEHKEWLIANTGCKMSSVSDADFVVLFDELEVPEGLKEGSFAYPDRSSTIVLTNVLIGHGEEYYFSGPGINGKSSLMLGNLPQNLLAYRANKKFPLGHDIIVVEGKTLFSIPRSTQISGGSVCM